MKLYVKDKNTKEKIIIDVVANNRSELLHRIGSRTFIVKNKSYTINDVKAFNNNSNTVGSALVGALVGVLIGPAGVAIGGAAGGVIGGIRDNEENERVKRFNSNII